MRVGGNELLVLTTVGARSGRPRHVPLGRFKDTEGRVVVVGAGGGAVQHPAWCANLEACPGNVVAQLPGWRGRVVPELLEGSERAAAWAQIVAAAPMYAALQSKTDRELPVIVLHRAEPA